MCVFDSQCSKTKKVFSEHTVHTGNPYQTLAGSVTMCMPGASGRWMQFPSFQTLSCNASSISVHTGVRFVSFNLRCDKWCGQIRISFMKYF